MKFVPPIKQVAIAGSDIKKFVHPEMSFFIPKMSFLVLNFLLTKVACGLYPVTRPHLLIKHKNMKSKRNKHLTGLNTPISPAVLFKSATLYLKYFGAFPLKVHPYYAPRHLKLMYRWATLPHASRFWNMDMDFKAFKEYYSNPTRELKSVVLILSFNDIPVAQVEVYMASHSEIAGFINTGKSDYGIHLLMAPYKELIPQIGEHCKGLSENILVTVLEMLFYISDVSSVYAEPDVRNGHSCRLAEKVGFEYIKDIQLSDKKARLYRIAKDKFSRKYPPPFWTKPTALQ
jgi:hypothetical protein